MRAATILFIALLIWPSSAIGLSGNEWLQNLQPEQRSAYIAGAIDGWGVGGRPPFRQLYLCVTEKGMTGPQLRAMVDKYIQDNPALKDTSLILLVSRALDAACK